MKEYKKLIIGIIIGIILASGISVYAYSYLASEVDYNKNGQAKVSDALDDLYSKVPSQENVKITETKKDIDVTNYKSIDTSELYTEDKVQLGRGTGTVPANETFTINNLNFKPSEIWIYFINPTNNGKLIVHANSSGGEYWAVAYNNKYYGAQAVSITNNGFSLTVTGWANSTLNWVATK